MEEHALRVVDNRVLRKISGYKREGVTGYWTKLCNDKLREVYRPLNGTRITNVDCVYSSNTTIFIGRI